MSQGFDGMRQIVFALRNIEDETFKTNASVVRENGADCCMAAHQIGAKGAKGVKPVRTHGIATVLSMLGQCPVPDGIANGGCQPVGHLPPPIRRKSPMRGLPGAFISVGGDDAHARETATRNRPCQSCGVGG